MNDSKEYVPSETCRLEEENKKLEEVKQSPPKKQSIKLYKKSSKYIGSRLSANESKDGRSDRISSFDANSVYYDNKGNSVDNNAYS
jgi:hypothetical protein